MPKGKGYLGSEKQEKDTKRAQKIAPNKRDMQIMKLKQRYNAEVGRGDFDKADKTYAQIKRLQAEGETK